MTSTFPTLKKEMINLTEILVTSYKITRCHNPEQHNLNLHCLENLRSDNGLSELQPQSTFGLPK